MGVKIKGKHLALFQAYADAWDPADWYASSIGNPHASALGKAIAGMHPDVLDAADAEAMLLAMVAHLDVIDGREEETAALSVEVFRARLCAGLLAYVESLPRRYQLTAELSSFPEWWTREDVLLAPDVAICAAGMESTPRFEARAQSLLSLPPHRSHPVLRVSVSGFGDFSADTPAASKAASTAKQAAYLLNTYGVVEHWGAVALAPCEWAGVNDSEGETLGFYFPSLAQLFSGLHVRTRDLQVHDMDSARSGAVSLLGAFRTPRTDDERNRAVQSKLDRVRVALAARDQPDYVHIAAAMEWYIDSLAADNQSVAFISACIGVEALIGTEEQSGQMSERLADRVGFLLGSGRADRESMRQTFRKLLALRGKLVHARQRRLATREVEDLRMLQSILELLIQRELKVLLSR